MGRCLSSRPVSGVAPGCVGKSAVRWREEFDKTVTIAPRVRIVQPEPKQMTLAARCVRILGAGMKHGEVIDDLQVAFLQIHGKGKAGSGDGSVDQVESLDVCLRQCSAVLGRPDHIVAVVAAVQKVVAEAEDGDWFR